MLLFQLPSTLPIIKRPASSKGKEKVGSSISSQSIAASSKGLEELPGGYMGKMLVYKSGAIKLKLGDTLYDVSHGLGFDLNKVKSIRFMAHEHQTQLFFYTAGVKTKPCFFFFVSFCVHHSSQVTCT